MLGNFLLYSIQVCRGSMRFNAWKLFVVRVEHPYTVRKLEKSLDMGEPSFHCEKTACYGLQQQTKAHALALAGGKLLSKTAQKAFDKVCSAQNQTISLSITSSTAKLHVSLSYPPPPPLPE